MPSLTHEALLLLFRNRPELAPELIRDALHVELPAYSEVRLESAELTDIAPAEYRADLVVLLVDGKPVLGIVVEVQLQRDDRKRFTWPVYIAGLRARLSCAACVLVVTVNEDIAQWSREPILLGPGGAVVPLVISPSAVPFVTDADVAAHDPELAVLSVMAHGLSSEAERLARVALEAVQWLDAERQVLYSDLVFAALGEATRVALEELMASGNYVFQSEFAKRHQEKGREDGLEKGRVEGRAEALLTVLEGRGLVLSDQDRARIRACTQLETLDEWLRRAATIDSVERLFT